MNGRTMQHISHYGYDTIIYEEKEISDYYHNTEDDTLHIENFQCLCGNDCRDFYHTDFEWELIDNGKEITFWCPKCAQEYRLLDITRRRITISHQYDG